MNYFHFLNSYMYDVVSDELGVILGVSAACFFFLLFAGVLILYR